MSESVGTRRAPRLRLATPWPAEVGQVQAPATVVGASLLGAELEHEARLAPGVPTTLRIFPEGREPPIEAAARVVWSQVAGTRSHGEEHVLVYRSGIEFVELAANHRLALEHALMQARGLGGDPRRRR